MQERGIYLKMCRKIKSANNFLRKNELLHPKNTLDAKIIYKRMPKMIIFTDINTFENQLFNYLNIFAHSEIKNKLINERIVYTYANVNEKIFNSSIEYLNVNSILINYPWLIESENIIAQLTYRFNAVLAGEYGSLLRESIETNNIMIFPEKKFDSFYKVIFIDNMEFCINTIFEKKIFMSIIYVFRKRKGGKIDLLEVNYSNKENIYAALFNKLKRKGIKCISYIISNKAALKHIKKSCSDIYKSAKYQYCLSSIFYYITQETKIDQKENDNINLILSANNE
jgi:hypothetical protein